MEQFAYVWRYILVMVLFGVASTANASSVGKPFIIGETRVAGQYNTATADLSNGSNVVLTTFDRFDGLYYNSFLKANFIENGKVTGVSQIKVMRNEYIRTLDAVTNTNHDVIILFTTDSEIGFVKISRNHRFSQIRLLSQPFNDLKFPHNATVTSLGENRFLVVFMDSARKKILRNTYTFSNVYAKIIDGSGNEIVPLATVSDRKFKPGSAPADEYFIGISVQRPFVTKDGSILIFYGQSAGGRGRGAMRALDKDLVPSSPANYTNVPQYVAGAYYSPNGKLMFYGVGYPEFDEYGPFHIIATESDGNSLPKSYIDLGFAGDKTDCFGFYNSKLVYISEKPTTNSISDIKYNLFSPISLAPIDEGTISPPSTRYQHSPTCSTNGNRSLLVTYELEAARNEKVISPVRGVYFVP